jgi:hypothetical protein
MDVTSRVRQWSAKAAANRGWRMSLPDPGATPLRFHASEYAADATLRPKLTVVYALVSTATTLSTSPNPSTPGQAVTLKATVTTSSGVATGTVTFSDAGVALGSAQLNTTGVATLVTSSLAPGTHSLVARYAGDAQHQASTSSTITQTVQQTSATTVVLQDGRAGYAGVADTYLYSFAPNVAYGASDLLYASAQLSVPLLRFTIFRSEGGSVPDGALIQSATLALYKQYYDSEVRLYALLVPWSEAAATWNRRDASSAWTAPGASGAGSDYVATPDVVISGTYNPGWLTMDVTSRVRQWSAKAAANRGWRMSLPDSGATPLRFHASEYAADATLRPKLTVVYVPPAP